MSLHVRLLDLPLRRKESRITLQSRGDFLSVSRSRVESSFTLAGPARTILVHVKSVLERPLTLLPGARKGPFSSHTKCVHEGGPLSSPLRSVRVSTVHPTHLVCVDVNTRAKEVCALRTLSQRLPTCVLSLASDTEESHYRGPPEVALRRCPALRTSTTSGVTQGRRPYTLDTQGRVRGWGPVPYRPVPRISDLPSFQGVDATVVVSHRCG